MRIVKNRAKPFVFRPFSLKQQRLLNWWREGSPVNSCDIVLADGSIRSGKTIAMICSFLIWSQSTYQDEVFIIAGQTIGALKRNVIKPMLQILETWGWKYDFNRSENYISIGTNTYYLFGASTEASQDVLQGLTAAGALADEAAILPQGFIDQMIGRCSVEGAKIFMNCNPRGPYHYIKVEFIDKQTEKRIYYIHFSMDDNLSLSDRVKERFRRMFSGVFFKRYILGLWVLAEGIIYDMFDEAVHCVEQLPPRFERLLLGVDYGTGNPTVLLLLGQFGNSLYVIDEYYWDSSKTGRQKTDAEYSADLKQFIAGRYPQNILIDPSAASFKLQLKRDGVAGVREANNQVVDGIRTVATFLGEKRLYVCRPNCPNLVKEFASYVWDPKAQQRGEDKPLKQSDHALDALRYCIHTIYGRRSSGVVNKPTNW